LATAGEVEITALNQEDNSLQGPLKIVMPKLTLELVKFNYRAACSDLDRATTHKKTGGGRQKNRR
jgi:hypothetical protein